MNKNIFQILLMMSIFAGFELGQASSDSVSGYDRYIQFIDYFKKQGEKSTQRLEKLKQLDRFVKLNKDIEVLSNEMNHEAPDGILKFIKKQYPQYIEGLALLGEDKKTLCNFIQQQLNNLPRDEDADISEVYISDILQAIEDKISNDMESTFIAALQKYNPKFIKNLNIETLHCMADLSPVAPLKNLEDDENPIVEYAMKYKNGWMKNIIDVWIRNWIINIGKTNNFVFPILHRAIFADNFDLVKMLIDLKIDVNITYPISMTTIIEDSPSLYTKIANINAKIDIKNKFQNTPLYIAVMKNNLSVVRELLKAHAKVDCGSVFIGVSNNVSAEIIKLLLDAGGTDFVNEARLSKYGKITTPLIIATINNNVEIVEILLNAGADINYRNKDNLTAFDYARTPEMIALFV